MNRRDFIKVAVAGFGTVLSCGAAINMLNTKSVPETAPIAEAALPCWLINLLKECSKTVIMSSVSMLPLRIFIPAAPAMPATVTANVF